MTDERPPRSSPTTRPDDATAELAEALAPGLSTPVDELHIAAELESRGVTDYLARHRYGAGDVFTLARSVAQRMPHQPDEYHGSTARRSRRRIRVLCHGPLYALPSVIYPALVTSLGPAVMVPALVLATAVGWIWAMGMSTAAYRLVGEGRDRAGARLMGLLVLTGLAVALVAGTVLALVGSGKPAVVVFILAQVGFQLGASVLLVYGMEGRVVIAMLPALGVGTVHLLSGYTGVATLPILLGGGLASVFVVSAALYVVAQQGLGARAPIPVKHVRVLIAVLPVVWYAVACAVLLLTTGSRFLTAPSDLSVAIAALVMSMGAVEWRSHRFDERVAELLRGLQSPTQFPREVWRVVIQELSLCLAVLGIVGLVLLALLAATGQLTRSGALLVDAYLVLGGAFFLGFVLANRGRFIWLIAITTTVAAVHVVATTTLSNHFDPYGAAPILLISGVVLMASFLVAIRLNMGRAYDFR